MGNEPDNHVRREARPTRWHQTDLFGPDVFYITMQLGVVVSGDHVQIQLESREPGHGALLSLWSMPHRPIAALERSLNEAVAELLDWIQPFP